MLTKSDTLRGQGSSSSLTHFFVNPLNDSKELRGLVIIYYTSGLV